jgi:hypothetical protein
MFRGCGSSGTKRRSTSRVRIVSRRCTTATAASFGRARPGNCDRAVEDGPWRTETELALGFGMDNPIDEWDPEGDGLRKNL